MKNNQRTAFAMDVEDFDFLVDVIKKVLFLEDVSTIDSKKLEELYLEMERSLYIQKHNRL